MKFTTKDRDNDKYSSNNCAVNGNGKNSNGWWFNSCAYIKLNQQGPVIKNMHEVVEYERSDIEK